MEMPSLKMFIFISMVLGEKTKIKVSKLKVMFNCKDKILRNSEGPTLHIHMNASDYGST